MGSMILAPSPPSGSQEPRGTLWPFTKRKMCSFPHCPPFHFPQQELHKIDHITVHPQTALKHLSVFSLEKTNKPVSKESNLSVLQNFVVCECTTGFI